MSELTHGEQRRAPVIFTGGPLGLVSADNPYRFVERTVHKGDHGRLIVEGELPFEVPEGWVLVEVEPNLYAPCHPSMVSRA